MLFLPLLFVQAQEPKSKRAVDIIRESERVLQQRGKVEDRKLAIDELYDVTRGISGTVKILAASGLSDPEDEIRIKAAQALATLGPLAANADAFLLAALRTTSRLKYVFEVANALANIIGRGSNPNCARRSCPHFCVPCGMIMIRSCEGTHAACSAVSEC